jgi:hypothetical protein
MSIEKNYRHKLTNPTQPTRKVSSSRVITPLRAVLSVAPSRALGGGRRWAALGGARRWNVHHMICKTQPIDLFCLSRFSALNQTNPATLQLSPTMFKMLPPLFKNISHNI